MRAVVRPGPRAWRAALAIASVVTAVLAAPTASADPVEYTQWNLSGDYGDYILGANDYSYGLDDGLQVTGDATYVSVSVYTEDDNWSLGVSAAQGDVLEAGRTYASAERFSGPDHPGISISGDARGCNESIGEFTIHELALDPEGVVTAVNLSFEQHCEGEVPAAYGALAWHSTMPPHALPATIPFPSKVVLSAYPFRTRYGATVNLRARLTADSDDRTISIYRQVGRGPKRLVVTAAADDKGLLTHTAKVKGTTKFTAVYRGPGNVPDARSTMKVTSTGHLDTTVAQASGKRGNVYLIGKGRRTFFLTRLLPKSPGDCMGFAAQFFIRGRWGHGGRVSCVRMSQKGVSGVYFDWDSRLAGVPIRIRAEWGGNALSEPTRSDWTLLKMVSGRVAARRTSPPGIRGSLAVPLPRVGGAQHE